MFPVMCRRRSGRANCIIVFRLTADMPQYSNGFKIAGISVSYRVVWYVSMNFTDGHATAISSVDEAHTLKTDAV